ncbi:MAG: PKD domain-containing protein [Chryseolinea sp.]
MKSNVRYFGENSISNRLVMLLVMVTSIAGYSQVITPGVAPIVERCGTMEMDSISRLRHVERGTLEEFEEALNRKVEQIQRERIAGRTMAVVSIPIVFHVIHNGEAVGTGTNLSLAQIRAQLEVLNEDFRKQAGTPGFNTSPVGADVEVEFCLSPVDENGQTLSEPGVDRFDGNKASWARDEIENQLKRTTIWNPNLFYNVWTLNFANTENLLGYAQFPDQTGLQGIPEKSPAATDGVVISYKVCGSADKGNFPVLQAPYNKGRTLTHETGHWLGLRHIWGDGTCGDDFVSDTPTHREANRGCTPKASCNSITPAMIQNYMDYSDDVCFNIFTVGQKNRVLAAIELSPRRNSVTKANLCSPAVADVPTANFIATNQSCVLLGSEIEFTDLSSNFPTSWTWEFEGGDPNISNERNPKVTYNTPGTFKVTLTATNSLGTSAPLVVEEYIIVSEEGLCNDLTNFDPSYTPSMLKLSQFGNYTGYLTGHNSAGSKGFSELFENGCGYKYISGAAIRFGKAVAAREDAKVTVIVWSARGPQGGPNPVIERKEVLLHQIQEDVANDRVTTVTFDRLTPIFSRPFHIGYEIEYAAGDTVAVVSSANGEATTPTTWVQHASGQWELLTTAYGANVALDIEPFVGANPSVQVSASKLIVYPGEEVVLNGQGASIFVWDADDESVENFTGPQLVVNPTKQTTYTIVGSGLELCNTTATTTIYMRESVVGIENPMTSDDDIVLYPNPGSAALWLNIDNEYRGDVSVSMQNALGAAVMEPVQTMKETKEVSLSLPVDKNVLKPGVYFVNIRLGKLSVVRKWIKL